MCNLCELYSTYACNTIFIGYFMFLSFQEWRYAPILIMAYAIYNIDNSCWKDKCWDDLLINLFCILIFAARPIASSFLGR